MINYVVKAQSRKIDNVTGRQDRPVKMGTLFADDIPMAKAIEQALSDLSYADNGKQQGCTVQAQMFVRVYLSGVGNVDIAPDYLKDAAKDLERAANAVGDWWQP